MRKNVSRRRFVGTVGAGIAGLTCATPVLGARGDDPKEGAEEKGIATAVRKLFENGKREQAIGLLDKHDVKYDTDVVTVPRTFGEPESDDVTTDEYLQKSNTSVGLDGYHLSGDLYDAGLWWATDITDYTFDDWGPKDGAAISFGESRWEYEPGTKHLNDHVSGFDPNPEGCIVEWDDGAETDYGNYTGNVGASFWVTLEKRDTDEHNVYGHYAHTYDYLQMPGGVSFGISAGVFSVGVSGGARSWQVPSNTIEM